MKNILIMSLLSLFVLAMLYSCSPNPKVVNAADVKKAEARISAATQVVGDTLKKVVKSESEWAAQLTKEEFYVLRKAGTERPFTGDLWNNKKEGIYTCRACQLPLFTSTTKYKSGTGWPSYYQPIKREYIKEDTDHLLGYARTEVMCARCDGHLGHVFPDGPEPTGLRYCINSVSLDFVEEAEAN